MNKNILRQTLFFFIAVCSVTRLSGEEELPVESYEYQLSICTVFQNEARFLKEWIEYHRAVGVEHFYLFNHLSEDDYYSVLEPYIDAGIVELTQWPILIESQQHWKETQTKAIQTAIDKSKYITKWLAIIDSDEFIIPVQLDNLIEALEEFENFGGVQVHWQCYGTSHIDKIPEDQLMIELLTMKAPKFYNKNRQIKSIVRPERVSSCSHPHYVTYEPGFYHVNEKKIKKDENKWFYKKILIDKLRINHYWTRDEEYYRETKVPRVMKREYPDSELKILEQIKIDLNTVHDDCIFRFIPATREGIENFTPISSPQRG